MRNLLLAAALAAGLTGPTAALAQSPAETPAGPAATSSAPTGSTETEDPNRLICKRERITGTNRREKVCMTVAERDRLRDASVARTQNNRGADYNKCIGGPGR